MTVSSLDFAPQWSQISAITQAKNAVITFTANHDFVVGQTVMFVIENEYGMRELNSMIADVSAISADTITVNIDTTGFTAFSIPATTKSIPQVIPVGSTNWGFTNQGTVPSRIGPSGAYRILS